MIEASKTPPSAAARYFRHFMATDGTPYFRFHYCLIAVLALGGCSATDTQSVDRKRHPTPTQAAAALACNDDEMAMCMDTNCELEDYRCVDREAARKLFKAGENRH